jgi:hypothetical protein
MKRLLFVLVSALLTLFFTTTAQAAISTTINPNAAPTGTHLQTGTIGCSVNSSTGLVSCTTYELAGVGGSNATAALNATYAATVQCRNHGGQIVEVKSQAKSAPTSSGSLSPKHGRLSVPALTSGPVPTDTQFENQATCPNGNWTKELEDGTVALSSFTYTLKFTGFTGFYITITGP